MKRFSLVMGCTFMLFSVVACMPSEIYSETERYARDARLLDSFDLYRTGNWGLPKDPAISVVRVQSSNIEADRYSAQLADTMVGGLRSYFPHIHEARSAKNFNAALTMARKERADYLLVPQLLVYDDAIGDWKQWRESQEISEVGRDKIKITLALYTAATGGLVENAYIEGRSGWLTFINSDPADLLYPAIEEYAQQLYGNH
ncbi:DUF4823 domain-containing protein [Aestuariirhabdus sp. LZHN29]|uniref:DUF4823 domain-containing protein n=1 Tax=Aestuariirhabdus sp. LZHN29 TaxID=3417462 RepID=UPI003CF9BB11